jgi:hypothetical protein
MRAERELLAALLATLALTAAARASAANEEEEKQRFRIPRQEFAARVERVGVWRLEAPEKMKLPVDLQRDFERWVVAQLHGGDFEVVQPGEIQPIWDATKKRIQPRPGAPAEPAWTEEMNDALRLHARHELRRRLALDALVLPSLEVFPLPEYAGNGNQVPAAVCLVARVVDLDGAELYADAGCLGVVERVVDGSLELRASANVFVSAMRRGYVVEEALHVLLDHDAPKRPD